MSIRITTLSENTANFGFLAEWGLSILVETDETSLLVDTGLSFSAVHNAQVLGIDLSTIDRIVLSHGHADHTGGLTEILPLTGGVEVFAHPDVFAAVYPNRPRTRQWGRASLVKIPRKAKTPMADGTTDLASVWHGEG